MCLYALVKVHFPLVSWDIFERFEDYYQDFIRDTNKGSYISSCSVYPVVHVTSAKYSVTLVPWAGLGSEHCDTRPLEEDVFHVALKRLPTPTRKQCWWTPGEVVYQSSSANWGFGYDFRPLAYSPNALTPRDCSLELTSFQDLCSRKETIQMGYKERDGPQ